MIKLQHLWSRYMVCGCWPLSLFWVLEAEICSELSGPVNQQAGVFPGLDGVPWDTHSWLLFQSFSETEKWRGRGQMLKLSDWLSVKWGKGFIFARSFCISLSLSFFFWLSRGKWFWGLETTVTVLRRRASVFCVSRSRCLFLAPFPSCHGVPSSQMDAVRQVNDACFPSWALTIAAVYMQSNRQTSL